MKVSRKWWDHVFQTKIFHITVRMFVYHNFKSPLHFIILWNLFIFHSRYDIPQRFVCEHDHQKCLLVLNKFVEDHSRLPIFHLDQAMFHTHKKFFPLNYNYHFNSKRGLSPHSTCILNFKNRLGYA